MYCIALSASDILLRVKKFHNSDMLLVRHFLTLHLSRDFCADGRHSEWKDLFAFHPVVQLHALPLNKTTKLIARGKSKLLREYHIAPDENFQWANDIHGDALQQWIERVVLRVISGGHLVPPSTPNLKLEQNECEVGVSVS